MEKRTIRSYCSIREAESVLNSKDPETVMDMNDFDDELKVDVAKFVGAFAEQKLNDWRTQTTIAGTALANRIEDIQMLLMMVSASVAGNYSDASIIQTFEDKVSEIHDRIQSEKKLIMKRGEARADEIENSTRMGKREEKEEGETED